jgi:hypothetical protein
MPILRVQKHRHNYVIMDKSGLEDDRLSYRARGLLAALLAKPDDWDINLARLAKPKRGEGRKALLAAMRELEQYGYADKQLQRDEKTGKLRGYVTFIYETPTLAITEVPLGNFGTEVPLADVGLRHFGDPSPDVPPSPRAPLPPLSPPSRSLDPSYTKDTKKLTPYTPPTGGAVAGSDAALGSFENWWKEYPAHRRVAKKQCARLWSQQGLEGRAAALIAHTQAMIQSPQWREGKIPNTTTYLREERYDTPPDPGKADTFSIDGVWALLDAAGFKDD